MPKDDSKDDEDWLKALDVMGRILIFTFTIPGALLLVYGFVTQKSVGVEPSSYIIGSILLSGFIAIAYAAYKRGRKESLKEIHSE